MAGRKLLLFCCFVAHLDMSTWDSRLFLSRKTASGFGQQVRLLDRPQEQCHASLLLSIHADAAALEDLHARWPSHVPVFANVRCGRRRWCASLSPFDSEADTPPHVAGALPL